MVFCMNFVIKEIISHDKKLLAFQSNPFSTAKKIVGNKFKDEDIFLIINEVDKYIRENDVLKLINIDDYSTFSFSMYDRVFENATEDINSSIGSYKPNDRVLTVLSSGDHVFNYLVRGVQNIETFDINAFTRYYFELKRAYIEKMKYSDFVENAYSLLTHALQCLDELPLSFDAYNFWNYYKNNKSPELYDRFLIKTYSYSVKRYNCYFEKENYERLQSILKSGIKIPFHRTEAIHLNKSVAGKFSEINFSSIYSLISKKEMPKLIRKMSPFLSDDGKMLFYSFGGFESEPSKYNKIGLQGRKVNSIDNVFIYTKKR